MFKARRKSQSSELDQLKLVALIKYFKNTFMYRVGINNLLELFSLELF